MYPLDMRERQPTTITSVIDRQQVFPLAEANRFSIQLNGRLGGDIGQIVGVAAQADSYGLPRITLDNEPLGTARERRFSLLVTDIEIRGSRRIEVGLSFSLLDGTTESIQIPIHITAPQESGTASMPEGDPFRAPRASDESFESFMQAGRILPIPRSATPLVSIILVMERFGSAEYTCLQALRAVVAQEVEVIVVTSPGFLGERVVCERVHGVRVIVRDLELPALAMNAAVRIASASTILFMDSGARLQSNTIERLFAHFQRFPAVGIVGGAVEDPAGEVLDGPYTIGFDGAPSLGFQGMTASSASHLTEEDIDFCSPALCLVSRPLLSALGGLSLEFDSTLVAMADLCLRSRGAGFRVRFDGQAKVTATRRPLTVVQDAAWALLAQRHRAVLARRVHQVREQALADAAALLRAEEILL